MKPKKTLIKVERYTPPLEGRKEKLLLDFNENTTGCSPLVMRELRRIKSTDIARYPEYGAFTKILAKELIVNTTNILPTNGSDEAIKLIMDAFLEEGNEIVLPIPTFGMFKVYASIAGAKVREIPYNQDLTFPTRRVLEAINNKTRIVILVNPNNPTGTAIKRGDIKQIIAKAKDSLVLIDEAYYPFSKETALEILPKTPNLVILRTFSKAYGLAGLRLGCIIANPQMMEVLKKVQSPYSVNTIAVAAGRAALKDKRFIQNYVEQVKAAKEYTEKELTRLGLMIYPSSANFLLVNAGKKCSEIVKRLRARNILVRDQCKNPLLKNCFRVSIGTPQQMKLFITELKRILRPNTLLFDLDGTLVDVTNSYQDAIQKTVQWFANTTPQISEIVALRQRGGCNNEWDLTQKLLEGYGIFPTKKELVNKFQQYYQSSRENETLLISLQTLQNLYKKYRLAIATGRPKSEALYVLERCGIKSYFEAIVTMEDTKYGKPNPSCIKRCKKEGGGRVLAYCGDTIDDIRAAVRANVPAIGIVPENENSAELKAMFKKDGAKIILRTIEEVGELFL